jgi:hypothetical protein
MLAIGSLGLVGNLSTILKIWSDKKFHTPTFAVIRCLAFADFLSIMQFYVVAFTNIVEACARYNVVIAIVLLIAFEVFYFSSLGHMILLSMVRYLITVHPLQSKIHLTASVVTLWSVTVWIMSLVLSLCELVYPIMGIFYGQSGNLQTIITTLIWSQTFISLIRAFLPFCILITLHCLKMKSLRSSTASKKTKKKMNLIMTVILSVFLTFQTMVIVSNTLVVLRYYGILSSNDFKARLMIHLNEVAILLGFVHFSCNPYIYFFFSCCSRPN